jgi:cobalt/nickel transport protein
MKKRLSIVLFSLFILIPLGLLSNSPAWAEWDDAYYEKILGFIPKGIANASGINAPLSDYNIGEMNSIIGYYLSAFIGIVMLFGVYFILMKILKRRGENEQSS